MAVETFSWCPKVASQVDTNFRTRKAQFGDGYAQVAGDGINPVTPQWSVSFTGDEAYIQAIKTFSTDMPGGSHLSGSRRLSPQAYGARNPSRYLPTATRNTPSVAHSYRHTIHEYFI